MQINVRKAVGDRFTALRKIIKLSDMNQKFKSKAAVVQKDVGQIWLGLHLVLGVAVVSRFLHGLLPAGVLSKSISEILIAVLLGLYLRALIGKREALSPGIRFSMSKILRFGIILLGLRLSLQDIAATGLWALGLVIFCIITALSLAYIAGRVFKIPPRLAALIGFGTAICGNSAIVATAPVIEADEEEVSFAVATITLFGLLAVIVYPLIGHLLNLPDRAFGLWSGTAVNDTSQVIAVSAIYSDIAQNFATIVKLTRNTLMAPLILVIGLIYNRLVYNKETVNTTSPRAKIGKLVPGFVVGFILMSLFRTLGVMLGFLPQSTSEPGPLIWAARVLEFVDGSSKFAILMALSAVGLNTDLSNLKRIGLKPLLVGTFVALLLSIISLSLILFTPFGS
jgi:uncharacterized integral membrane protein (TIGR00698 family)